MYQTQTKERQNRDQRETKERQKRGIPSFLCAFSVMLYYFLAVFVLKHGASGILRHLTFLRKVPACFCLMPGGEKSENKYDL
jgi:hypothetical protein